MRTCECLKMQVDICLLFILHLSCIWESFVSWLGNRKKYFLSLLSLLFCSLKAAGVGDVPIHVQVHAAGPDLSRRPVLSHTKPALEWSS